MHGSVRKEKEVRFDDLQSGQLQESNKSEDFCKT